MTTPGKVFAVGTWRWLAVTASAVAASALLLALIAAGGAPQPEAAGLPDPGLLTGWGLPVITLVEVGAAALTVGHLLLSTVLLPRRSATRLSSEGRRLAGVAGTLGWIWWGAALLRLLFEVSERVAEPLPRALRGGTLTSYVTDTSPGRAALAGLLLSLPVALFAGAATALSTGRGLLLAASAAVAAPAAAGHTAGSDRPWLAIASLGGHVVAIALWTGGLAALVVQAHRLGPRLPAATGRFSQLALGCFLIVAVTGVLNATVHASVSDLSTSGYGALIVVKVVGLTGLGALGAWHRYRTLPVLTGAGSSAFVRFAAVEVLVIAVLFGVAVALAATPPPS